MNSGLLQALLAFAIWGFFPLYWRLLQAISADQITAHRILWSWLVLVIVIALMKQWRELRSMITRRVLMIYTIAAVVICINWLIYVWAANANHLVETSLGFFIQPLFNVFLGTVLFKERLRPLHWLSLLCATTGVIYLTYQYGHVPWIAVALASTGALYAVVKKIAPLQSLFGLTLETTILAAPALIYLILSERNGNGTLLNNDLHSFLLLFFAGIFAMIPLLLFASAAQRIPFTLFGMLQYISPTIQIMLGIFFFHEPFSSAQLLGFSIVWIGLAIFAAEGFLRRQLVLSPEKS